MKKKVKISKSGMISIIALVFGFGASLISLFGNSLESIMATAMATVYQLKLLQLIVLPLMILTVCFIHIWRTNKQCKTQILYLILGLVSVGLYLCGFAEVFMLIMAGSTIQIISYIPNMIVIIGIIVEFILLGVAEKVRGSELCYTE